MKEQLPTTQQPDEPTKNVLENINFAMRYLTDREFAGARFPDIDTAVLHLQSAVRKLTEQNRFQLTDEERHRIDVLLAWQKHSQESPVKLGGKGGAS